MNREQKYPGFNTRHYKVTASIIAGGIVSLAGSLYAVSLRFVNTSVMSLAVTLDAFLITIIGDVSTLIGPVRGAGGGAIVLRRNHHENIVLEPITYRATISLFVSDYVSSNYSNRLF